MERTSLRRDKIIRDKWESNSLIFEGDNLQASHGFSSSPIIWPHQRNYTCRFCKRDFNSAQALGGHMNVHRRDRAMLRQLPPSFVFKQNLTKSNPSFLNFSSCSSSLTNLPLHPPKYLVPYSHTGLSLASPSPSPRHGKKCTTFSPPIEELKKEKSIRRSNLELLVGEFNEGSAKKFFLDHQEVLKEDDRHREVVSLDLEMGFEDSKEVLDLELRLGCF